MKLEEAIGRLKHMITVRSIIKLENLIDSDADLEYIKDADAVEIVLQEIEHLQKENEELKRKNERLIDRTIQYDKTLENLLKNTIWKEKIRNLIEKSTLNSIHINELIKLLKEG